MHLELELCVTSDWTEMERVHQAAADFLESAQLPPDSVFRHTMIICELVENGIKYGNFRKTGTAVSVLVRIADKTITVQVTNPVGSGSEPYLRELDRTIQWVRGFQDPFEAYLGRIKEISREPLDAERSGLGISRITYEGRAALDFFLDEDRTLSVSAVSTAV
jgi:hypothetical protein